MKARFLLIAVLFLSACSSGTSLLDKPGPAPVGGDSLITPPWQAMVRAGPGAEKDLDYETLDGTPPAPTPPPGIAVAPDAVPPGSGDTKPATAAASAKDTKPGTEIKAVAVLAVTGLSPQGSKDLTDAMRKVLRDSGWPVLDSANANALTIKGDVKLDAANGPNQAIHINWVVASPAGKNIGTVSQNNDVPAHSLDNGWGATAGMAAQAAADGIFKLIEKYR